MGAFRYYFGFLYIVYHEKKGFWNNDKKKYVDNPMKATLYKNKKCAKDKAKEIIKEMIEYVPAWCGEKDKLKTYAMPSSLKLKVEQFLSEV